MSNAPAEGLGRGGLGLEVPVLLLVLVDLAGSPDERAAVPVVASVSRLGAVYPSAQAAIALIKQIGIIPGWDEYWDRYFQYELLDVKGGVTPASEGVVFDGKYVTAAGVSSGIDMGLTLAGRISGDQVAQSIQLMIEYDPQPPYDAGSPDRAPAEIVDGMRARSRFPVTGRSG